MTLRQSLQDSPILQGAFEDWWLLWALSMSVTCCLSLNGGGRGSTLIHCQKLILLIFSKTSPKGPSAFSQDDCALRRGNKH